MAKGKKTGGKDFKPGESGNPKGRPALPGDVREARRLTRIEFEKTINRFLFMTLDQITEHLNDPATTALDQLVGRIVANAIRNGDHLRSEFLLSRTIGKAADAADLENEEKQKLQSLTNAELLEQAREAMKVLASKKEDQA
jgi:single-stranded DNA-specific DHH superfamily exonuclease